MTTRPTRRGAHTRVFADHDRTDDDTRDDFPAVGEYDTLENVSGAPSPNTQIVRRPRTITPPPPGQHVSHRTARMIDATSGEKLDAELAEGLTLAAQRRLSIRRTVEGGTSVSQREYEDHVFGLNRPGRGRAEASREMALAVSLCGTIRLVRGIRACQR